MSSVFLSRSHRFNKKATSVQKSETGIMLKMDQNLSLKIWNKVRLPCQSQSAPCMVRSLFGNRSLAIVQNMGAEQSQNPSEGQLFNQGPWGANHMESRVTKGNPSLVQPQLEIMKGEQVSMHVEPATERKDEYLQEIYNKSKPSISVSSINKGGAAKHRKSKQKFVPNVPAPQLTAANNKENEPQEAKTPARRQSKFAPVDELAIPATHTDPAPAQIFRVQDVESVDSDL